MEGAVFAAQRVINGGPMPDDTKEAWRHLLQHMLDVDDDALFEAASREVVGHDKAFNAAYWTVHEFIRAFAAKYGITLD